MATICKNCLVELQDEMKRCPLCDIPVDHKEPFESAGPEFNKREYPADEGERHLLQKILWQVTAILLFSGIVATLLIDIASHKRVTWSLYPVAICMIVLAYSSLFAFWQARTLYRILAGWLLSSLLLFLLAWLFPAAEWTIRLGIPIVFAVNFISLSLLVVSRLSKRKGLNLFALAFVALAVLCMSIDGIISRYATGQIGLGWSIIVTACLLPVATTLIFMFYRTRNNKKTQKIFHT